MSAACARLKRSSRVQRVLAQTALLAAVARRENQRLEDRRLPAPMLADQQVFQRGHLAKQADILVRAGDAQPRDAVRRHLRDRLPGEGDAPAGRVIQPADAVDQRGLARAVGSDQPAIFPG